MGLWGRPLRLFMQPACAVKAGARNAQKHIVCKALVGVK